MINFKSGLDGSASDEVVTELDTHAKLQLLPARRAQSPTHAVAKQSRSEIRLEYSRLTKGKADIFQVKLDQPHALYDHLAESDKVQGKVDILLWRTRRFGRN